MSKVQRVGTLNSFSSLLNLFNSELSSKAVRIGSLEERQIKEGDANALKAFIRDCEWFKESSLLFIRFMLMVTVERFDFRVNYKLKLQLFVEIFMFR